MDHRRLLALDLNLLVLFDALIEERSVTRAGRRLGASQPAVSRGLAKLRAQLGDAILVRSGRDMLPTPRAALLAPSVRRLLHETLSLMDTGAGFDPARSTRTFTIAAAEYAERVLLAPLIARLRREAPGLGWVVRPATALEIPRAETGDVDLGITPLHAEAPGLSRRLLWRDPYVLGLAPGAPLAQRARPPTAREYAALDHVVVSPEGHGPSAVDDELARDGLARRVVLRTPSLATAITLARDGLALALPSRVASELEGLVTRPLPFLSPLAMHLVRHERYARDAAISWLAAQVIGAARSQ